MLNTITQGNYGILSYIIERDSDDNITYFVEKDEELISFAKLNFLDFLTSKVPQFGKFEVEEFVGKMLLSCLIKGDLTDLMNTSISYYDCMYNIVSYPKEIIRGKILKICKVIEDNGDVIKLKYLGKF